MSTLIKRYIMKKLFLFLFSSCSSPISDNKYRTIINKMPYHFDPRYHSSTLEEFIFEELIHCKLITFNQKAQASLELAKELTWKTPTELFIKIHPHFTFSNNKPVQAKDIASTYLSLKKIKQSSRSISFPPIQDIIVHNNTSLTFLLKKPVPFFENFLLIGILPEDSSLEKIKNPIGCGKYITNSFNYKKAILEHRKKNFYVSFEVILDDQMKFLKLLKKEVNFITNTLSLSQINSLKNNSDFIIKEIPALSTAYLSFNMRKLSDLNTRIYLRSLVDKKYIIKNLFKDLYFFSNGLLPNFFPVFKKYDHEIPFKKVEFNKPLKLITTTNPDFLQLATYLQQEFKKENIILQIYPYEWSLYIKKILENECDLFLGSFIGFVAPDMFHFAYGSDFIPPRGLNRSFYQNSDFDKANLDQNYSKSQEILWNDPPSIFLWHGKSYVIFDKTLLGIYPTAQGRMSFLNDI